MGPLSDQMKKDQVARQGDIKFDITWTTLGEYLDTLVARGVSSNVASFVSASTVRAHEIGYDNRAPTAEGRSPQCATLLNGPTRRLLLPPATVAAE